MDRMFYTGTPTPAPRRVAARGPSQATLASLENTALPQPNGIFQLSDSATEEVFSEADAWMQVAMQCQAVATLSNRQPAVHPTPTLPSNYSPHGINRMTNQVDTLSNVLDRRIVTNAEMTLIRAIIKKMGYAPTVDQIREYARTLIDPSIFMYPLTTKKGAMPCGGKTFIITDPYHNYVLTRQPDAQGIERVTKFVDIRLNPLHQAPAGMGYYLWQCKRELNSFTFTNVVTQRPLEYYPVGGQGGPARSAFRMKQVTPTGYELYGEMAVGSYAMVCVRWLGEEGDLTRVEVGYETRLDTTWSCLPLILGFVEV